MAALPTDVGGVGVAPLALALPDTDTGAKDAQGMPTTPQSVRESNCNTRRPLKTDTRPDESLVGALNAITNEGMGLREASRVFGIPALSLRDHLYGRTTSRQRGSRPTLRVDKEKKLLIIYSKCRISVTHLHE